MSASGLDWISDLARGGGFVSNGVEKPRNIQVGSLRCEGVLDGEGCKVIIGAIAFCSYCIPVHGL